MKIPRMNFVRLVRMVAIAQCLPVSIVCCHAATLTDNFNSNVNYLSNGVSGTIWDGIYFGAGEFANSGVGGGGPGATVQCDANIAAASKLTLQTTGTAWEGADDDGFFLYRIVKGDFSAIVHVVTPFNAAGFNTAGLQARAFSANGDPSSSGKENYVSWARFDEFSFANYLRNEVNGAVSQINPQGYPNSAYWLRMERNGNTFHFFQKTNSGDAWILQTNFNPALTSRSNLIRNDFANLPLQVGIMHATFNNQLGVQFSDFSITATNFDSFGTPPSAATGLATATNGSGGINVSWTSGFGSAGSVVVLWPGTTNGVKQIPINGTTYTGNASFRLGSPLTGAGCYVVYSGSGTNVTVNNLALNATYNVAVFAYSGSGSSIAYNRSPPTASFSVPPNQVVAQINVTSPDVTITFSANPGKWYWLQSSDSLTPPDWQNLGTEPVLANSAGMVVIDVNGALAAQRYYRLQQLDPEFGLKTTPGAITSVQKTGDVFPTEYMAGGARLGDANMKYRQATTNWTTARTVNGTGIASATYSTNSDGTKYSALYQITNTLSGGPLVFESRFTFHQEFFEWTLNFTNLSSQPVEVGDVALPLRMNMTYSGTTSSTLKHHHIEGNGSFVFWMRPNSVGPYLLMTPSGNAKLEYWDVLNGGFEAYVHSLTAASIAATQNVAVTTGGMRWRQTNTSLTLGASGSQSYTFKFQWADDYDGIRQALVNEGSIDVHVVPGMTLPTNLTARIALRTTQAINGIDAEFPATTQIISLGSTNVGANTYQLYQVQFSQLGENRLTVRYGSDKTTHLEFFVTEPVETLIKKRASFLVNTIQINDASKWYNSLYADLNMNDGVRVTPDNHDTLGNAFQVYEIASDDAGESRPAFMAEKLAVYPVQSEVASLDNYITNFVWGGLQRKTNESSPYAIYGVPDWHTFRTNNTTSFGRGYDYPHIVAMYYGMYKVAKYHPEISTYLSANEYLLRAYGTARAMWTFGGGQATHVGLMNELVISDLLDDLHTADMTNEETTLRGLWETKVAYYVNGNADLFASEYAFDSTGFESQQAYAKYAFRHAGTSAAMGSNNVPAFLRLAGQYMNTEITANVFDRGWLETAYYYYGSDYRGNMGNDYVVTYMSQEGGWGLLDYAFYYATNATDYLRLGIGSYLNGWSTMNTGTPSSNYGFWYPGAQYDGGCGGGFEPAPLRNTWLANQPMHRGAWYYSAEQDLGFCGAMRMAASVLADDPIFGRFAYLGTWQQVMGTNQFIPLDGVRRRFHTALNGSTLHMVLDNDRFAANQPIMCKDDQSLTAFQMESEVTNAHTATLHFTVSVAGLYTIGNNHGLVTTTNLVAGQEAVLSLPVDANATSQPFSITR